MVYLIRSQRQDSQSDAFPSIKKYTVLLSVLPVGIVRTDTLWIIIFTSQIQGKYGEN